MLKLNPQSEVETRYKVFNDNKQEKQMGKLVTLTAPVLSSSTPTASKFNLFVLGARPVTNEQSLRR